MSARVGNSLVDSAKLGEPSARHGGGNPEPSFLPAAELTADPDRAFGMRQRRYTDEQLETAVAASRSIREVLSRLGLKPAGGNHEVVKKRIRELN
jgi:hypothetical protein